jgi:maleylacetoacetate isomerase
MGLTLHAAWRSGASYRTRIALNLKGLAYDIVPVNLLAGNQRSEAFKRLNPLGLAPALEVDGGVLTQSPAILEWLEEVYPDPPLLPSNPLDRAQVRAMAALIACDIQPLNNLRVLRSLKHDLGASEAQLTAWMGRWMHDGFAALETLAAAHGGDFCFGNSPTLADVCLIPQLYAAHRYEIELSAYPRLCAIEARACSIPAFAAAHPDRQPDAL